jgi:hypothetical protein
MESVVIEPNKVGLSRCIITNAMHGLGFMAAVVCLWVL